MEELLSNETAFDLFFNSLDRVKNLKTFQEDLLSGNETLARKYIYVYVYITGYYNVFYSHVYIDKNLGREDQLLKLRSEVENLDSKYKLDKLEFERKEKLQHEAFNVSKL
jgi:ESCRT-I complex subunit VPS37